MTVCACAAAAAMVVLCGGADDDDGDAGGGGNLTGHVCGADHAAGLLLRACVMQGCQCNKIRTNTCTYIYVASVKLLCGL